MAANTAQVHCSGVSRIMLKGAQYTAPPTLSKIRVTDHWRWSASDTVYLDASCVAVRTKPASGSQGAITREVVGEVSYTSTSSHFTRVYGAMRHSGDIMDFRERAGKHTMDIDLAGLGLGIDELFFLASIFHGKPLRSVQQPLISIEDPDTGMELCSFCMNNVRAGAPISDTAIVMCRVFRGHGRWHVQALGETGPGDLSRQGALRRTMLRAVERKDGASASQ